MNKIKTILTVLFLALGVTTLSAQEFKRKIEQHTFVPKGQWITGASVSYSEYNADNYKFLVIEGINTDGYTFKVSPMLCYTFKDNLAAGGRFFYKRTLTKVNSLDFNLDEDTNFNISDVYSLSHSWGGIALLRNYISLGTSRRFALYNEVQISMEKGQSKLISGKGDDLSGTYQTSTDVGIGLSPGLVAFVNNYMAVEVSVGVLGLNFSKVHQTTDRIYVGERSSSSANFKINLFSISLGMAFYL